jgi:radical SAM superfamily enzyme YgiQ (UPF0313 family)
LNTERGLSERPVRILLIEPAKAPVTLAGEDVYLFEPLALEYVGAAVSADHEVRILDQRLDKDVRGTLESFRPHVVGITSYTVHVNCVKRLFEQIKEWNPEVLTVVGGHHATVVPEDFRSPSIDLVVRGDGVFAFKEIVRRFDRGEGFEGIPGMAFTDADDPPLSELDDLPFPDRSLTASYRKEYYSEYMKPLASIRTSKGCPYRCSFCALWKIAGGRYLKRDPRKIVEELAGIEEEFVFFADDESLVDVERMKTLAGLIGEAGIRKRFFLYGRSDTITRHPELLAMWKEVGLERVFVGFEFFRDEDLELVRKGSTIDDNGKAAKILHDLGIEIYASFIIRPEFEREDFEACRRYCRELELSFASFAVLTPLPGTDLYEEVKERMIVRDYEYYDFIHTLLPTALPLKEFYREYYRLYTKGIPLGKAIGFLWKFPAREILPSLAKGFRWYGRLKRAYKDYDAL